MSLCVMSVVRYVFSSHRRCLFCIPLFIQFALSFSSSLFLYALRYFFSSFIRYVFLYVLFLYVVGGFVISLVV